VSRPRRVLFLHSSAGHYGADRQLRLLATSLDPARWHPLVVLPFEGPLARDLRAAGVEVLTGPLAVLRRELTSVGGLATLLRDLAHQRPALERLIAVQRIDVVHANTSVILGLRPVAPRLVISVREIYPRAPLLWPLHRRAIRSADAVLCVSEATRSALGGAANVSVVLDGLAVAAQRAPRAQARLALGLPQDAFVVAVLGRVSAWKGQEVLARALATPALAARGAIGLIAGDAWPGQEHRVQALRDLGLGSRLRLLGFRGDLDVVLGASDAVAVPSTAPDPLPNAAIEAAAAGCPVVASAHGGLPEILRDGSTGLLVAPGDPGALAAALARLADDPGLRERLGSAAAADVRERFAPEALAGAVMAVYDSL